MRGGGAGRSRACCGRGRLNACSSALAGAALAPKLRGKARAAGSAPAGYFTHSVDPNGGRRNSWVSSSACVTLYKSVGPSSSCFLTRRRIERKATTRPTATPTNTIGKWPPGRNIAGLPAAAYETGAPPALIMTAPRKVTLTNARPIRTKPTIRIIWRISSYPYGEATRVTLGTWKTGAPAPLAADIESDPISHSRCRPNA